jgi:NAD(P)H dehydrogenase (quinone)
MPKIAIIYYSTYGHMKVLADEVKKGVEEAGCECDLLQVPETLSDEVLAKMGAPPKDPEVPIATVSTLSDYDGFMFGIPTRFGAAGCQMKSFWDATGSLWQSGALVGKPAGIFISAGTQGGGMETTALTWITQLTHHGMLFVPMGYSNPKMFTMDEVHGGSPYGCGTFAGADGSRMASDLEKELAVHHGKHFAGIASKLAA